MLLSIVGYFSTFSMAILSDELLTCHLDSKESIVLKRPHSARLGHSLFIGRIKHRAS
jgi:hypothetical protein